VPITAEETSPSPLPVSPRFGARKQQFSESLSESPESRTALGVLFYPPMSRIPPEDLELVAGWCASLAVAGMAPSAVVKAGKRVRAVAQSAQAGLLHATRDDLAAFVASRAARLHAGHVDPLQATLRGRSLRETVKALRAFYAWAAEHQLVNPRDVPTGGLRMRYPLPRERIRLQLGRRYDRLLHVQGPPHYVAICWLLAHGLEWRENLKPDDVDLERREIRLARRTMPITASALAVVCAWVGARQRLHAGQWLFGEQGRRPTRYVFQDCVQRLSKLAGLRRRVRMEGFRHVFLLRCLHRGIAADCVPDLLGVELPPALKLHVTPPSDERLHHERD
jgi:site-specific recombinase XerC